MLHLLGATGGWLSSTQLFGCSVATKPDRANVPECTDDWWLCGGFAPVEETESTALEVEGSLPGSLAGVYARNGPNPAAGPSGHWFLGDGMVHAVRIEGGEAKWFRARYVQTDVLGKPADQTGPPTLSAHQANTSLLHHDDKLLCLNEVGAPYALSRTDLATIGVHDFGGQLEASMTAHPKLDPATGEIVFFGYDLFSPSCRYYVADAEGTFTRQETIELRAPVMMHDFQMTASHVVWMDLPILFDIELAVGGEGFPFEWVPGNGARIGVMPRDGGNGDVEWFDIDPCFVFHTFNAFNDPDDPNKVILDAIRYPQMWVEGSSDFDSEGSWHRFTMTLGTGDVKVERMDDRIIEFPRIDPRKQGTPHRYGYAITASNIETLAEFDTIVKYDVETGDRQEHALDGGLVSDEPTFIAASDTAGEDEGWLLSYAYDRQSDKSQLVILDARDVAAGPVARVKLPQRVPHGFHGTWSPG